MRSLAAITICFVAPHVSATSTNAPTTAAVSTAAVTTAPATTAAPTTAAVTTTYAGPKCTSADITALTSFNAVSTLVVNCYTNESCLTAVSNAFNSYSAGCKSCMVSVLADAPLTCETCTSVGAASCATCQTTLSSNLNSTCIARSGSESYGLVGLSAIAALILTILI